MRDRLGLEFEEIPPAEFRSRYKTHYRAGLRVTSVRPDGPAAKAGLRDGDVLVGVHVWETTSLESLRDILGRSDLPSDSPLKLYVLRGGKTDVVEPALWGVDSDLRELVAGGGIARRRRGAEEAQAIPCSFARTTPAVDGLSGSGWVPLVASGGPAGYHAL